MTNSTNPNRTVALALRIAALEEEVALKQRAADATQTVANEAEAAADLAAEELAVSENALDEAREEMIRAMGVGPALVDLGEVEAQLRAAATPTPKPAKTAAKAAPKKAARK